MGDTMETKSAETFNELRELAHSIVDRELIIDSLNEWLFKAYNLIIMPPFKTPNTTGTGSEYMLYSAKPTNLIGRYSSFNECFQACLKEAGLTDE